MVLQTHIPLKAERFNPINYSSKICFLGSCFSEHIGKQLAYYKFQTFQNPFGILFHPKAIETLLTRVINQEQFTEKDIFYHNERWHCFEVHSDLSHPNKETILSNLNTALTETFTQLQNATHCIFTFGTAWVYRYIAADVTVANCHKVPQKQFLKELLSVDEVAESLDNCIALLRNINPKLTVMTTVSPVRHLKDGFVENQRSKAHLLAGIHQLISPKDHIHYFPSYEIMMDELRDYRYYAEDMLHPNQTAIRYIWEKFRHVWISHESEPMMKEIETIQKGLAHTSFNPKSVQHQEFQQKLQQKITALQSKFPSIKF